MLNCDLSHNDIFNVNPRPKATNIISDMRCKDTCF